MEEASYDEASRAWQQIRRVRPGGGGQGGSDAGLTRLQFLIAFLFGIITLRLIWLQLIDPDDLASAAESQRTNAITLHAKRGTIYDRNGNVLAMSVDCKTVYADPSLVEDPSGVAAILHDVLGGGVSDYMALLTQDTTFVYIELRVDLSLADELESRLNEKGLLGINFIEDTKRVYPYDTVGAQIIGYVGTDNVGLSGLEYYYDDILTGVDGEMIVETGLYGSMVAGGVYEVTEATNGQDIIISLDIDLQEACENIITAAKETYSADSGSVMITEPKTGEILAACSTPLPDFSNLTDVESLNLKMVTNSYEPGSVFKVLTTSIGFNLGLFTPDTVYSIPGQVKVGDDYVTDDDGRDYTEDMAVKEMMRRSSNTAMATLVQEVIGAKSFSEGLQAYGIGSLTGIDFPGETKGIVKKYDEYDGSTAGSMAFGQGVAIPMVQLVRAYGSVACGGIIHTPHFLVVKNGEEVEWPEDGRSVSEKATEYEIECMRLVMQEGTGTNGQVEGYDIAGKTGTGEQASSEGGYREYYFTASLCGFANASDPEVLVYVGLNGVPYLALASAAPTFHDVMEKTVAIMGVAPAS